MALTLVSRTGATELSKFVSFLAGKRPGEGKTFACFVRKYDGAHLARHPQQNITAIRPPSPVFAGASGSRCVARVVVSCRNWAERRGKRRI